MLRASVQGGDHADGSTLSDSKSINCVHITIIVNLISRLVAQASLMAND